MRPTITGLWDRCSGRDPVACDSGGNNTTECEAWGGSPSIHDDARGRGHQGGCSYTSDHPEERHGTLRRCVGARARARTCVGVCVCVFACVLHFPHTDPSALAPMQVTIGFQDPKGRRQTSGVATIVSQIRSTACKKETDQIESKPPPCSNKECRPEVEQIRSDQICFFFAGDGANPGLFLFCRGRG